MKCQIARILRSLILISSLGRAWIGCISIRRCITYTCNLLSVVQISVGSEMMAIGVYFLQVYLKENW